MTRRHLLTCVAAGWLAGACGHEAPFAIGRYAPAGMHSPGAMSQLTFNPAADAMPALTPDGAGVWYTFVNQERPDGDSCLGLLPAAGGSRAATWCWPVLPPDSIDALAWPAPVADGRLALAHTSSWRYARDIAFGEISVWPADGGAPQRALVLPWRGRPGGDGFDRAAFIHWLDPGTLLFVGHLAGYVYGLGIERLTLGQLPVMVAGTSGASALDLEPGRQVAHFTLNGDSRVLALDLATGDTATVWDFGGVARDPRVRAGRLLAVVGGVVGPTFDGGGSLRLVDLATSSDVSVGDSALRYRHPILSSDGRRAIVEVVGSSGNDLWAIALP